MHGQPQGWMGSLQAQAHLLPEGPVRVSESSKIIEYAVNKDGVFEKLLSLRLNDILAVGGPVLKEEEESMLICLSLVQGCSSEPDQGHRWGCELRLGHASPQISSCAVL